MGFHNAAHITYTCCCYWGPLALRQWTSFFITNKPQLNPAYEQTTAKSKLSTVTELSVPGKWHRLDIWNPNWLFFFFFVLSMWIESILSDPGLIERVDSLRDRSNPLHLIDWFIFYVFIFIRKSLCVRDYAIPSWFGTAITLWRIAKPLKWLLRDIFWTEYVLRMMSMQSNISGWSLQPDVDAVEYQWEFRFGTAWCIINDCGVGVLQMKVLVITIFFSGWRLAVRLNIKWCRPSEWMDKETI